LGFDEGTILSVSVVDSDEMTDLNRRYRNKDGPTNVLSFSQLEGEPVGTETGLLGDVVICADVAQRDAETLGYTLNEMMLYLLIHGVLHLTGHSHDDPDRAIAMQARVDELFQDLLADRNIQ
jgi:probable rRNA maturation factor